MTKQYKSNLPIVKNTLFLPKGKKNSGTIVQKINKNYKIRFKKREEKKGRNAGAKTRHYEKNWKNSEKNTHVGDKEIN